MIQQPYPVTPPRPGVVTAAAVLCFVIAANYAGDILFNTIEGFLTPGTAVRSGVLAVLATFGGFRLLAGKGRGAALTIAWILVAVNALLVFVLVFGPDLGVAADVEWRVAVGLAFLVGAVAIAIIVLVSLPVSRDWMDLNRTDQRESHFA